MAEAAPRIVTFDLIQGQAQSFVQRDCDKILTANRAGTTEAKRKMQGEIEAAYGISPEDLASVWDILRDPQLTPSNARVIRFFLAWESLMGIKDTRVLEEVRKKMKGADDYTRILDRKIEFLKRKTG